LRKVHTTFFFDPVVREKQLLERPAFSQQTRELLRARRRYMAIPEVDMRKRCRM
jgi:hypothetical protein